MKDSDVCCGSAGIYNLTHYDISMQLLDRKMDNLLATGMRPSWRPILAARCSSPTAPAAEASPSSSSTWSICWIAPTAAQRLARRHSACSSSDRNIHETSA